MMNSVIIYSLLCSSKPVKLFVETLVFITDTLLKLSSFMFHWRKIVIQIFNNI